MTGREKIEAAFSKNGTKEIPAVICYETIYIRDAWKQLTSYPWYYTESPDIELQMLWRSEVIEKIGQDWFRLPLFYSKEERQNIYIDVRPEGVFKINKLTGEEKKLIEPQIGGWPKLDTPRSISIHKNHIAETPDEIDKLIPIPSASTQNELQLTGRDELAKALLKKYGEYLFPIYLVGSPFWGGYTLWGFEGLMTLVATKPELVEYACKRFLTLSINSVNEAKALGAAGVWIDECFTDMISPKAFSKLVVPFLQQLVEECRTKGLKSIYYFCGNPAGKWEQILSIGADALAFEESKKNFTIDIEEVVTKVQGRCTLLGNLDAIGILQNGTEEQLRKEILRQIAAGKRNNNRFIMSIGSPVTPGTPVERVRRYCDLVHELGSY